MLFVYFMGQGARIGGLVLYSLGGVESQPRFYLYLFNCLACEVFCDEFNMTKKCCKAWYKNNVQ